MKQTMKETSLSCGCSIWENMFDDSIRAVRPCVMHAMRAFSPEQLKDQKEALLKVHRDEYVKQKLGDHLKRGSK